MSQEMLYIYAPRVNNSVPVVSRKGVKKVPKVEKFEALNENDLYNEFENDDLVLADVSTEIDPEEKMTLLDNNRAVDLSI